MGFWWRNRSTRIDRSERQPGGSGWAAGKLARRLVFQRHQSLISLTKCGHPLQAALGMGYNHHRAVAKDGVTGFGKVPLPAFASLLLDPPVNRHANRGGDGGTGEREQQYEACKNCHSYLPTWANALNADHGPAYIGSIRSCRGRLLRCGLGEGSTIVTAFGLVRWRRRG
jgi:hypothetical protein